ncbi:MAG: WXG100 family type VII secretion target [Lachnospiraceae bacterium]|nr:WXG100 family type VII secretion target [Lachnospiraceae bacterium]
MQATLKVDYAQVKNQMNKINQYIETIENGFIAADNILTSDCAQANWKGEAGDEFRRKRDEFAVDTKQDLEMLKTRMEQLKQAMQNYETTQQTVSQQIVASLDDCILS